jgi:hypothetical protein
MAAWLLLAALGGAARAQEVPSALPAASAALRPLHRGYAFEQPEILVRQRLFGLAHGLSLLAGACLDVPEQAGSAQEAYAAWHAKQAATIERLALDLARYYFGERSAEAVWTDLARALNLKETIQDALGEVRLEEACASLPTAIIRPRYEFDKLLAESMVPGGGIDAAAAVSPAPTPDPAPAEARRAPE